MEWFNSYAGREVILILAGYALGCFCTGYYLVRIRTGQDIRNLGSGSTGGRNVSRVLGAAGFIITFLGDVAKGAVATWAALFFQAELWGVMLVMFAVAAGHVWPVQLGFRGGKGLATAVGAALVFDYRLVMILAVLALVILGIARNLTLSGLIPVAVSPIVAFLLGHSQTGLYGITALAVLVLYAHRVNIRGLMVTVFRRAETKDHS